MKAITIFIAAIVAPASSAIGQVAGSDSAAAHRQLAVHVPFFIPFFHHRHHAGRTFSAQPDSNDVVSIEAGYDGNFNSPELARDESSSIAVVITPFSRLELQADLDFWASEAAPSAAATSGRGDAHLRAQWTVLAAQAGHAALAIAYIAKIPEANSPVLGTGFMDHRLLVPVTVAFHRIQLDAYAGIDADSQDGAGATWGAEAAVSATLALSQVLSAHLGVSGQSIDTDQPAGRYLSAGVAWQVSRLVAFDLGARAGLNRGTPQFGLTAGITTAIVTR